jgi:peptidoglycan hydrolase CwlO-like protein
MRLIQYLFLFGLLSGKLLAVQSVSLAPKVNDIIAKHPASVVFIDTVQGLRSANIPYDGYVTFRLTLPGNWATPYAKVTSEGSSTERIWVTPFHHISSGSDGYVNEWDKKIDPGELFADWSAQIDFGYDYIYPGNQQIYITYKNRSTTGAVCILHILDITISEDYSSGILDPEPTLVEYFKLGDQITPNIDFHEFYGLVGVITNVGRANSDALLMASVQWTMGDGSQSLSVANLSSGNYKIFDPTDPAVPIYVPPTQTVDPILSGKLDGLDSDNDVPLLTEISGKLDGLDSDNDVPKLTEISDKLDNSNTKLDDLNSKSTWTNTKLDSVNTKLNNSNTKLDNSNIKLNDLNSKVTWTNTKLDSANIKLNDLNSKVNWTNTKLDSANQNLNTTNQKLTNTNTKLDSANSKLNTTNQKLTNTNTKLDSANSNLSSANQKLVEINTGVGSVIVNQNQTKDKIDTGNSRLQEIVSNGNANNAKLDIATVSLLDIQSTGSFISSQLVGLDSDDDVPMLTQISGQLDDLIVSEINSAAIVESLDENFASLGGDPGEDAISAVPMTDVSDVVIGDYYLFTGDGDPAHDADIGDELLVTHTFVNNQNVKLVRDSSTWFYTEVESISEPEVPEVPAAELDTPEVDALPDRGKSYMALKVEEMWDDLMGPFIALFEPKVTELADVLGFDQDVLEQLDITASMPSFSLGSHMGHTANINLGESKYAGLFTSFKFIATLVVVLATARQTVKQTSVILAS